MQYAKYIHARKLTGSLITALQHTKDKKVYEK